MGRVTVRVPATTANLGPGFDSFGCALALYNELTFEETEAGLRFSGCDPRYANEDNLAYQAYRAAMEDMGLPVRGLNLHMETNIPVSRGLGSSAALLAAGAMAASTLHGGRLDREGLLRVTTPLEGHPDNLAPAIYGGLTASFLTERGPRAAEFALCPDWRFTVLIPDFELSTRRAREALPDRVSLTDAVFNVSHGAMTLKALELGEEELLGLAMEDRLHQNYRRGLIDGYDRVETAARDCGAAGFCISGAGPTLLCLSKDPNLEKRLAPALGGLAGHWRILTLKVDGLGARVVHPDGFPAE